jgi:hypothetical protein
MEIHEPFAQAFCNHSQQFETLRRYTAAIERGYYRSLETLRKLQKDRKYNELGTVSQNPETAGRAAVAASTPLPHPPIPPSPHPENNNFGTVSYDAPAASPRAA